jgi:hypothetical protein
MAVPDRPPPVDTTCGCCGRQATRGVPAPLALWTTELSRPRSGQTAVMSVEVPVLEVFVLADRLRAVAALGHDAAARLTPGDGLGGLQSAVSDFLDCVALAGRAAAAETDLLGATVAGVADSWLVLDRALLARRGHVRAR